MIGLNQKQNNNPPVFMLILSGCRLQMTPPGEEIEEKGILMTSFIVVP